MIHRLEFTGAAVAGSVELTIPESGPVSYRAVFSGEAIGPGFLVVNDDALPRPRGEVAEVRGDGLWTVITCETPDQHWSFGLEAFGLRVDDPTDEVGDRIPVGYDLEWETPDLVTGDLLLSQRTLAVVGRGSFSVK